MKKAWWGIRFFLSFFLLYLVYDKLDWNKCVAGLSGLGVRSFAAYASNWIGVMFLPSIILWLLARSEKRMPLTNFIAINHVNRLYSLTMPVIVATGARFVQYVDAGISPKYSVVMMVVNKSANLFNALAGVFIAGLILKSTIQSELLSLSIVLSLSLLGVLIVCCLAFRGIFSRGHEFKSLVVRKSAMVARTILSLSLKQVSWIVSLALLGHLFVVLSQWLLLCDVSHCVGFIEMLWARSIVSLVLMLPVSVAGIGFREVGLVTTLAVFGVATHDAAVLAMMLLGFQVIHGLMGFVMEQVTLARNGRKRNGS